MRSQTLLSEKVKKKRGPAPTEVGTLIGVRLRGAALASVDAWISKQPRPRPSRPEAIRRLLGEALGATADAGSIAVGDLNASNDE
jgi:hypothetical protein